jgi:hypothetical protein
MSTPLMFPANSSGPAIVKLLLASVIISCVSLALNLVCLGLYSLFIPAAWLFAIIHRIVLWCALPRQRKAEVQELPGNMPRCLKHAGNIWALHYLFLAWLVGGITTMAVAGSIEFEYTSTQGTINIISGVLAVIEAMLLLAVMIICWRALSKESYDGTAR